jgi:molybdopterin molybdotransferase
MKSFFNVTDLETVFSHISAFGDIGIETVYLGEALGRVLAEDIDCRENLPGFNRSVMDGYAVKAASTFGASEGNPAYLSIKGAVTMGSRPAIHIGIGEAARISTGGALPEGADSVVMVEHSEVVDDTTIEVYKSVPPGQHVIQAGEDFEAGRRILSRGRPLRAQEIGLLAAFGHVVVPVFKQPVVGILSTGDELVTVTQTPDFGQVRDINSFSLAAQVNGGGGLAVPYGVINDDLDAIREAMAFSHGETDMLIISGGSSVGARDFVLDAISNLPDAEVLLHGIPIRPGKPTILAQCAGKPVWGLPGHVVSAMIVFEIVVKPFLERLCGLAPKKRRKWPIPALLTRNIASAQGRTDFVRVRLILKESEYWAEPIPGKSGLIHTLVQADGILAIDENCEGLEKGARVLVIPI